MTEVDTPAGREAAPEKLDFEFHGSGGEFFRIWIVNVVLSIITLGIYSAWAKVRTKRYFYGNTRLDNHSFEYLARPVTILKGRLIAVAVLMLYVLAEAFFPLLLAPFFIAAIFVIPWVFIRAYAFNARNSSYRGIRFQFDRSYGQAVAVLVGLPILAGLTFGLLYPLAYFRREQAVAAGHSYGRSGFSFRARARDYFLLFLVLIGAGLLVGILMALVMAVLAVVSGDEPETTMYILIAMTMLWYLVVGAMATVRTMNLRYNNIEIGGNCFHASYHTGSWLWLLFSNTLLTLFTLGLFIPWAMVRVASYRARHTRLTAVDLDRFVADERVQAGAAGDELGEAFDLGFGV